MDSLIGHARESDLSHFMVMQCLGTLATANVAGSVPFIKTIFSSILPNLGGIKLDHVKQSYAYGKLTNNFINSSVFFTSF